MADQNQEPMNANEQMATEPELGQNAPQLAQSADGVDEQTGAAESAPEAANEPEVAFSWEASEYVHHHKSAMWYMVLVGIVIGLIALAVWLQLWLEIGLFIVMAVAVVVYARKPPRTMLYELSADGIQIDGKPYPFDAFRSFAVVMDEEWHSIDLEPARRFNPRLVMLYDPEDIREITGHLERHLPRVDREPDVIERITRLVRF